MDEQPIRGYRYSAKNIVVWEKIDIPCLTIEKINLSSVVYRLPFSIPTF